MKSIFLVLFIFCCSGYSISQDNKKILNKIENYQKYELKNGLKVLLLQTDTFDHVFYKMHFEVPRFEDAKLYSGLKILSLLTGSDCEDNYQITKSMVSHPEAIDSLLEFMSKILLEPQYNEKTFEKLKSGRIEYLNKNKNIIEQNSVQLVYKKKNQSFIKIQQSDLNKINYKNITDLHYSYIKPENAILTVVGNISIDSLSVLSEKYFGNWKKKFSYKTDKVELYYNKKISLINDTSRINSHITFINAINKETDFKEKASLNIFKKIIFNANNGFLSKNFIKNNITLFKYKYDFTIFNELLYLSTSFEINNKDVYKTISEYLIFLEELKSLIRDPQVIQPFIKNEQLSFNKSLKRSNSIATYIYNIENNKLSNDYYTKYNAEIKSFSVNEIQNLAKKIFTNQNYNFIIHAPEPFVYCQLTKLSHQFPIYFYDLNLTQYNNLPKGFGSDYIINQYLINCGINKKLDQLSITYDGIYIYPYDTIKVTGEIYRKEPNKYKLINNVVHAKDTLVFHFMEIFNGKQAMDSTLFHSRLIDGQEFNTIKQRAAFYPELYYKELNYKYQYICNYKLDTSGVYKIKIIDGINNQSYNYYDSKTFYKLKSEMLLQDSLNIYKTYYFYDYRKSDDNKNFMIPERIIDETPKLIKKLRIKSTDSKSKLRNSFFDIEL